MIKIKEKKDLETINADSPIIRKGILQHFEECVEREGTVYLVFDNDKLIFRICIQQGEYFAPILGNAYIKVSEPDSYVEYAETHPNYRGQRIYPWVLSELRKEPCPKGSKQSAIYVGTDMENVSSQKGIARSGFRLKEIYVLSTFLSIAVKLREKIFFGDKKLIQFPLRTKLLKYMRDSITS
jgi:hypothetical protein